MSQQNQGVLTSSYMKTSEAALSSLSLPPSSANSLVISLPSNAPHISATNDSAIQSTTTLYNSDLDVKDKNITTRTGNITSQDDSMYFDLNIDFSILLQIPYESFKKKQNRYIQVVSTVTQCYASMVEVRDVKPVYSYVHTRLLTDPTNVSTRIITEDANMHDLVEKNLDLKRIQDLFGDVDFYNASVSNMSTILDSSDGLGVSMGIGVVAGALIFSSACLAIIGYRSHHLNVKVLPQEEHRKKSLDSEALSFHLEKKKSSWISNFCSVQSMVNLDSWLITNNSASPHAATHRRSSVLNEMGVFFRSRSTWYADVYSEQSEHSGNATRTESVKSMINVDLSRIENIQESSVMEATARRKTSSMLDAMGIFFQGSCASSSDVQSEKFSAILKPSSCIAAVEEVSTTLAFRRQSSDIYSQIGIDSRCDLGLEEMSKVRAVDNSESIRSASSKTNSQNKSHLNEVLGQWSDEEQRLMQEIIKSRRRSSAVAQASLVVQRPILSKYAVSNLVGLGAAVPSSQAEDTRPQWSAEEERLMMEIIEERQQCQAIISDHERALSSEHSVTPDRLSSQHSD